MNLDLILNHIEQVAASSKNDDAVEKLEEAMHCIEQAMDALYIEECEREERLDSAPCPHTFPVTMQQTGCTRRV